uniref:Down syndrome cell adhesion molecule-like protein Dscam2 n=1 Tax=Timema cristinae TaxID=61476 RepID=A0A7R9CAW8_TIMCR|nr:unnamed protein product [Timema cristinae]
MLKVSDYVPDGKYHMLPSGELLIRRVDESDKYRSYQCRAVNRLTGASLLSVGTARFSVTDSRVVSTPRPIDKQVTIHARKDQTVVLPCFAEGNPPPTYKWFRQDRHQLRVITETDDRMFVVGECLAILHVDEGDAGRWVCVANNTAGVERIDLTLQVTSSISIMIQPSGQLTVDVGGRAEMQCIVTGSLVHTSSPIWLKDGHVIGPVGTSLEKLILENVQRDDAGMYQCIVRGEDDSAQSSVQLQLGAAHPQLLYKFINQTLQPGPPVSIKCIATGNPTPHIIWHLDGFPLPQNERFVIGQYVTLHGDVISHVNISNVQVEDGGIYQCTASNRVGEISHSADMRVYGKRKGGGGMEQLSKKVPNKFTRGVVFVAHGIVPAIFRPFTMLSSRGQSSDETVPPSTPPYLQNSWLKHDSHRLPTNRRQHVFPNGTLLLENVQKDADKGEYRCRASNNQGQSASQILPLNVIVPPRIAPFSFQTDLHLGDRAGVQCFITKGDLPLKIEWQKDGAPIEADVGVRQLGEHISSLSIESLRPHHAGIYKCQASNSAAQDSHSSRLLVNVPPRIGPFTFGELIEGVRTQVQCVIQAGDPPLTLKWLKDDEILPLELGIQVTQDTYSSTLAIPRVSRMHAGNYTCIAGNPAAKTASVTAQLVVSVPPRWVAEPRDHKVSRDETVMFHCQAEGFPNPTLIWRKIIGRHPSEYQDVTVRSRGLQLFSNGTLYIRQALPEHQGQYLCEATNGVGAGLSALVTLTVHVPPMFEVKSTQATVRRGASQTLQCQAHGDGPMSIVWQREDMRLPAQLKPRYDVKETTIKGGFLSELHISNTVKSDSGTFNCIAKNPFGRSERTVHLQVQDAPGRPQDLRVLDCGSRRVKLAWLDPTDDRSPILQYIVQYQQESHLSANWQTMAAGTELFATISGLQPATHYKFRVVAENELGAGEPSENIVVRTEGEAPTGEPQSLSVTAIASDQLRVSWTAPVQNLWNGEILGYYVGYREHGLPRTGISRFESRLGELEEVFSQRFSQKWVHFL